MKSLRPLALTAAAALAVGAASMLAACGRVEQAPALSFTLLDGRASNLAALRGHVVLVNFWATDCAPCVEEMPALAATWRQYAPAGLETLAIAMSYDPPALVSNFARSRALPFGVVIDNTGELAARLGDVRYTPTSLLINKRGEIVRRWVGKTDFAALGARIEALQREP